MNDLDDILKEAAEAAGEELFNMLRQKGQHVVDAFKSEPVRRAGGVVGEGLGRMGGAVESMVKKPSGMPGIGAIPFTGSVVEHRGTQGLELGRQYAPHVAGGLAALATGYALKKLLFDRDEKKNRNPEIYIDRSGYPNYY